MATSPVSGFERLKDKMALGGSFPEERVSSEVGGKEVQGLT